MRRWAAALVLAPLLLGALLAGVLVAAGERRMLQTAVALPALFLAGGVVLSALCAAAVALVYGRRRIAGRIDAARREGLAAGVAQEKQNHRRFVDRLDHELKNPLTAIRATVAAAGDGSRDWQTVDAQAGKLGALVRDLRKLAELDTRPLEREPVDLEAALAEAIAAVRQQDAAAGERLSLAVTRVPWPVPTVSADLDLLSLAIDNVLGNAVKYSSDGPIEVRLREQEGWAVIEVADSGRGIPASDLPTVFDELARARNARDVAGSGIGLALVSTVLARHGGDVAVRSIEGSGTVATIRLPLTAEASR